MARDAGVGTNRDCQAEVPAGALSRSSSAGPRRSWHARPSSSSWRSRPWRPTRPSGYRPPRRRRASRARPKRKSLLAGHCPKARRAAQRNPLRAWLLSASLEHVRRQLKGSDDGDRPMVKILSAMLTDGLTAVEAACAEALASKRPFGRGRPQHPGAAPRPPPAASILTPSALRSRTWADWTRCDRCAEQLTIAKLPQAKYVDDFDFTRHADQRDDGRRYGEASLSRPATQRRDGSAEPEPASPIRLSSSRGLASAAAREVAFTPLST